MSVRKSTYVFEYRITFLGAEKVGKSTLIHQFTNNQFTSDYNPTTEDHLTHVCEHDGNMCVCLFVDTSGSNDFPAMRKLSVTKGNAFVVVYSINDKKSYERAKHFINEIKELKGRDDEIKIVLVGNKTDLKDEREVCYSDGSNYAANLHEGNVITKFLETSGKDYNSIKDVIDNLLTMFSPPPSQVDVPVITNSKTEFFQRRLSLRRLSKSGRRNSATASTKQRTKSDDGETKSKTNRDSFSDSELSHYAVKQESTSPKSNQKKFFRKRSGSQPVAQTLPFAFEYSNSPSTGLSRYFRKSSTTRCESINEIGTPTLISSSSISRYNLRNRSISVNSNCSDDSGVSGDCNSPEVSPGTSPKMNQRPLLMRRGSLPVQSIKLLNRRPSLSEKMQKIFRRSKSAVDSD